MATPLEICQAKCSVVGRGDCGFGLPNKLNPMVTFTGCPACKRDSANGVTAEDAKADMQLFMDRMK